MSENEKLGRDYYINTIYENTPSACVLFDAEQNVIGCNPQALTFYGFATEEELKEGLTRLINDGTPPTQPDGRDSIYLAERLTATAEGKTQIFDTYLEVGGSKKLLSVVMKHIAHKDGFIIALFTNEWSVREERFHLMTDFAPLACVLLENGILVDCNMEAARFMGFSGKSEYLRRHQEAFPNEQSFAYMQRMTARTLETGRETFEFTFISTQGEDIPAEVTTIRLSAEEANTVVCYARDLREVKRAENDLEIKSRLLQTVNEVATILIESDIETNDEAVRDSLRILGEAANVDRAYIWENYTKNGRLYTRQLYEWAGGVEPQQGKPHTLETDYELLPIWRSNMLQGIPLNGVVGRDVIDEESVLSSQGIKSILLLPIHFRGKPWGFIGFDDCVDRSRIFSLAEEQVLHSAGILIVSSIERNKMTRRVIKTGNELHTQGRFLSAVNEVASILLETEEEDFGISLNNALGALGAPVEADAVSIWANTRDEEGHFGSRLLSRWLRTEAPRDEEKDLFIDFGEFFPGWYSARCDLHKRTEEMSDSFRSLPVVGKCASYVFLPVSSLGDFWGFIAFCHVSGVRTYSDSEKNILRSGGMLIGSAIIRNEINESLVDARESALESARSKSAFLSRMSHEIRTPISAIIGMTTLAKKTTDMSKINHYLSTVDSSSRQLLDIINDVLDMSKIDADKLELANKEFDFEGMLKRVLNVIQVKIDEKKIHFHLDFPHLFKRRIISDELRLSQVLINLLSNSLKFTSDYGSIKLGIQETRIDKRSSLIRMTVEDDGVGIAPERLEKMFNPFEQADGSITRQFGGTGLGLAICKRIVDMMGGQIWVESEQGKGSKFIVEITAEWGGELTRSKDASILPRDLRILVVDDAPDVLEYFREILKNFSLECDTAASGYDAVAMAAESIGKGAPYDVVFVDWFMPGMNGGETAAEIKRIMSDDVIVVMISVAAWNEIEKEASSAGVRYFLSKPVLSSELLNVLNQLAGCRNEQSKQEQSAEAHGDWSGHCILVVEDNDINREIVGGLLEETGIGIEYAENGLEGVNKFIAEPSRFELILMDVHMPILDGLAATGRIRSSGAENAKTIPIIAMTADAFKEDEQTSIDAGMNGHISKPFDASELLNTIEKIIT